MTNNLELGDLKITISTNEDEPIQAKFEMPNGSIVTRPFPNTGELTMKLGLGLGINVVQASGGPSVEAPTNTVLPAISGDAISGKTLSVTNGTWDDGGAAISGYTYQWKDDGVAIGGATANTFLLTDTQIGGVVTCTVTATTSAGSTDATSGGTAAVVAALDISGTPVLTGTEDSAYAGFTATGSGGEEPYTYSLVGTWPAGITINSSTGEVSGTPTESGTFASLSVRVTDANLDTADLDSFTIDVDDSVVFPVVAGTNTSTEESAATSHDVLLPASISAGDLLIIMIALGGAGSTISTPDGWSPLFSEIVANRASAGFYKVATGSEGASVAVTSGASLKSAHQSFRITGYQGTPEAIDTSNLSTNPDAPNLAPSWGSDDNLWLVYEGHRGGTGAVTSAAPSNYTNLVHHSNVGNTNSEVACSTARRELTASSENPGTFTTPNSNWVAATIAIRGA